MSISGINHVNILTEDLDGTAGFYEQALGLTRTENPAIGMGFKGAWMCDAQGQAIVHLVWKDPAMERYAAYMPGAPTNAVHHVAFNCTDFDGTIARLKAMGAVHQVNDLAHLGLRQIFLADPNAVNLELNFA